MEKKVMASDLISLVNANNLAFCNHFESLAQDILRNMRDAIERSKIGDFYGYQHVGYYIDEISFDGANTPTVKTGSLFISDDIPGHFAPYSYSELSEESKVLCDLEKILLDYLVSVLEDAGVKCYCTQNTDDYYDGRVLIWLDVYSEATDDAE